MKVSAIQQRRKRIFIERCIQGGLTRTNYMGSEANEIYSGLYLDTSPARVTVYREQFENFWKYQAIDLTFISWFSPAHPRVCNWIWAQLVLRLRGRIYLEGMPMNHMKEIFNSFIFNDFYFDEHAFTTEERYFAIIDFLDYWKQSADKKLLFINGMKGRWAEFQQHRQRYTKDSFQWLDINEEAQCEWAWEFIHKKLSPLGVCLFPRDGKEMFHDTILVLDLLCTSFPNEYNAFINDLRNAWAQQKIRNKNKDELIISLDMKKKLAYLAKKMNCTPAEAMDKLLDKECAAFKG